MNKKTIFPVISVFEATLGYLLYLCVRYASKWEDFAPFYSMLAIGCGLNFYIFSIFAILPKKLETRRVPRPDWAEPPVEQQTSEYHVQRLQKDIRELRLRLDSHPEERVELEIRIVGKEMGLKMYEGCQQ